MTTKEPYAHDPAHETVLDVDVEKLARIYAQAVLNAAGDHAAQQRLMEELEAIGAEILAKYPDLEKVFDSALISEHEKIAIIDRVFGERLSQTALNFLKVLAQHGRLGLLRYVIRAAGKLWKKRCDQVAVQLELAREVDEPLLQEILATLSATLKAEPIVSVKVNPALIAGFVARVGDRVYDASTRTALERTRQNMITRAIESIQREPHHYHHADAS